MKVVEKKEAVHSGSERRISFLQHRMISAEGQNTGVLHIPRKRKMIAKIRNIYDRVIEVNEI